VRGKDSRSREAIKVQANSTQRHPLPLVRRPAELDNPAMDDPRLVIETPVSDAVVARLEAALEEHARAAIGDPGFHSVGVVARDAAGTLVGGVTGAISWTWLSVRLLWVAEERRGTGLGRRLMEAIENLGRTRGCTHAHVDTLGFQAPQFYRRLGYEAFAELPDYAPGQSRIYFRKRL